MHEHSVLVYSFIKRQPVVYHSVHHRKSSSWSAHLKQLLGSLKISVQTRKCFCSCEFPSPPLRCPFNSAFVLPLRYYARNWYFYVVLALQFSCSTAVNTIFITPIHSDRINSFQRWKIRGWLMIKYKTVLDFLLIRCGNFKCFEGIKVFHCLSRGRLFVCFK